MLRLTRFIASLALAFSVVASLTAQGTGETKPAFEPPPDAFDWVQLKSGEWLKGEFIGMYDDELEFDSDKLDLLKIDWDDVSRVRTERIVEMRLSEDRTERGKLDLRNGDGTLRRDDPYAFRRQDIIAIAPGARSEWEYWSGKISLGLTIRRGNSERTEANAHATFQRRSALDRIVVDYLGAYDTDTGDTVANNHRATGDWNRFLTDRFYVIPASVEYFRDPFQNISQRWTGSVGAGYEILQGKADWRVFGGPAFQWIKYKDVPPGQERRESAAALRVGTEFEYALSSAIDFTFEYTANFTERDLGRYTHHMVAMVETELTSSLDLDVSFVWDRIADPPRESDGTRPEKDDTRIIVALGLDF